jgi:hypothetical protein
VTGTSDSFSSTVGFSQLPKLPPLRMGDGVGSILIAVNRDRMKIELDGLVEWGSVPWSLWAYAVLTAGIVIFVLLKAAGSTPAVVSVLYVSLFFAWDFFLLRAVR